MIEPYSFQKDCIDRVGLVELVGRLIADEMGLGKTVEAAFVDAKLRRLKGYPNHPTLIIASLAVHDHWKQHLQMVGIHPSAICVIDRKDRNKLERLVSRWAKGEPVHQLYFIVHYDGLRLCREVLRQVEWFHIIADECHRFKNKSAQQTRALKEQKTHFKTGLSGTPADDKPQDIWSVLNWLYPRDFRGYWPFVNRYCTFDTVYGKGQSFRKISGVRRDTLPELQNKWKSFYIRRTKDQVWEDMPDKIYTTITVELPPGQRKPYDQMRKHMIAWIGEHEDEPLTAGVVVAQLVRLQQFALATAVFNEEGKITLVDPSVKLDALNDIVMDNEDEQHVVFTQSRSMANLVAKRLQKEGVALYTGSTTRTRDKDLAMFQGGVHRIFAGTIAAGGEGINLQNASTVHLLDRHWSPSKNEQAIDRCHRIGQKRNVQIFDYVAKDTIDLGRNAQIAAKWETIKLLLGDTVDPEEYIRVIKAT